MKQCEDNDVAFLDDIREACVTIATRLGRRKFTEFVDNGELRDSIVLQLIHIGEAANNLTDIARSRFPEVPWRAMTGLRNLLVHSYWTTDALKLWETASKDIPVLLEALNKDA